MTLQHHEGAAAPTPAPAAPEAFLCADGALRALDDLDAWGAELATRAAAPRPKAQAHTVYNFEVEGTHTYIAGGYRVHNTSAFDFLQPGEFQYIVDSDKDADGTPISIHLKVPNGNAWVDKIVSQSVADPTVAQVEEVLVDQNGVYYILTSERQIFEDGEVTVVHRDPKVELKTAKALGDLGKALTPFLTAALLGDDAGIAETYATNTVLSTVMENAGEMFGALIDDPNKYNDDLSQRLDRLGETILGDFDTELADNAAHGAASLVTRMIMAEIFVIVELDGAAGAVFGAITSTGVNIIVEQGLDIVLDGLGFTSFNPAGWSSLDFTSLNPYGIIASAVLNEVLPALETAEGNIASSIASLAFSTLLNAAAGAFAGPIGVVFGYVIGRMFDSFFAKHPEAFAQVGFDPETGRFVLLGSWSHDGGDIDLSQEIAQEYLDLMNQLVDDFKSESNNLDELGAWTFGHYEESLLNAGASGQSFTDFNNTYINAYVNDLAAVEFYDGRMAAVRALEGLEIERLQAEYVEAAPWLHLIEAVRQMSAEDAGSITFTTLPDQPQSGLEGLTVTWTETQTYQERMESFLQAAFVHLFNTMKSSFYVQVNQDDWDYNYAGLINAIDARLGGMVELNDRPMINEPDGGSYQMSWQWFLHDTVAVSNEQDEWVFTTSRVIAGYDVPADVQTLMDTLDLTTERVYSDREIFELSSATLQIAYDFHNYLENQEVVDAIIAAAPDSAEAAGWVTTLLTAQDMGLLEGFTVTGDHEDWRYVENDTGYTDTGYAPLIEALRDIEAVGTAESGKILVENVNGYSASALAGFAFTVEAGLTFQQRLDAFVGEAFTHLFTSLEDAYTRYDSGLEDHVPDWDRIIDKVEEALSPLLTLVTLESQYIGSDEGWRHETWFQRLHDLIQGRYIGDGDYEYNYVLNTSNAIASVTQLSGADDLIALLDVEFVAHPDPFGNSIFTSAGDDVVDALEGDDIVHTYGGDDWVSGGNGDDVIKAGGGTDFVDGGAGDDDLNGGWGEDTYLFRVGDGVDLVFDIDAGNTFDLRDADGNATLSLSDISVARNGANLIVEYSADDRFVLQGFFNDAAPDEAVANRYGAITLDGGATTHDLMDLAGSSIAPIGEVMHLSVNSAWQHVDFSGTYQHAVIFALSPTTIGADAVVTRLKDIGPDGADIRLQETNLIGQAANDGYHDYENVTLLVLEKGVHVLSDGTVIEVGELNTNVMTASGFESVAFSEAFDMSPAVFAQVQGFLGTDFVSTRLDAIDADGFRVALEEEEQAAPAHMAENVGWLAVTPGSGDWNGIGWQAGVTGAEVDETGARIDFHNAFDAAPLVMAAIGTYEHTNMNSVTPRLSGIDAAGMTVTVQEDTSYDQETDHIPEGINWLAFSEAGVFYDTRSFAGTGPSGGETGGALLIDVLDGETFAAPVSGFVEGYDSGAAAVSETQYEITLSGNAWKSVDVDIVVTEETWLSFSVQSDDTGEILAIGVETGDPLDGTRFYQLGGTDDWGRQELRIVEDGDGAQRFHVNLGALALGRIDKLVFALDDDADESGSATFSNLLLREIPATTVATTVEAYNLPRHAVTGWEAEDVIVGGDADERLSGWNAADLLYGGGGDDYVRGESGNDSLYGGDGVDYVYGGSGDDLVDGGDGNDRLWGGVGQDVMSGGAGNDKMNGDAGNDDMSGGDGDDEMHGSAGEDVMRGDAGNDWMQGGTENDEMYGGDGDDMLYGDAGDDYLHGGQGNDELRGDLGLDTLDGADGDDRLYVEGADILTGGAGADVFVISAYADNARITDFTVGEDVLDLDLGGVYAGLDLAAAAVQLGDAVWIELNGPGGGGLAIDGVTVEDLFGIA